MLAGCGLTAVTIDRAGRIRRELEQHLPARAARRRRRRRIGVTTTTRLELVATPAMTAAAIALRSAQIAERRTRRSRRWRRVKTCAARSATAAPTWNFEYGAYAARCAAVAAATEVAGHCSSPLATSAARIASSSDSNVARTRVAVSVTSSCDSACAGDAGGVVGDARDADHARAHVPGDDDLGHRRHAGRVGAERLQHLAPRPASRRSGRASRRTRPPRARCPRGAATSLDERAQLGRVGVRHVGEPRAEALVVGAAQRVVAEHVDVIADQHQRARRSSVGLSPPAALVDDQDLGAERDQHARGERDGRRAVALVHVDAALHRDAAGAAARLPSTSRPLWPTTCERGKPRDVAVVDARPRPRACRRTRRGPSRGSGRPAGRGPCASRTARAAPWTRS